MYFIKCFIPIVFVYLADAQTYVKKCQFSCMVTFGDSHTDTGNVYNLTNFQWPLVPPYYKGRFSNGPLWIDNINASQIMNYAYADATIDNDNLITGFTGPNNTIYVPSIREQIVNYLAAVDLDSVDLRNTLYVIWAGGNEYLINSTLTSDKVANALLNAVYDLLVTNIQNIIIINIPPLHLFPIKNKNPRLGALINQHNNYLATNISYILSNYGSVSIKLFDVYSLIIDILSNKTMYSFNTDDKCWDITDNHIVSQCSNPNNYVFIDSYHFTSAIHQIIADQIEQIFWPTSTGNIYFSKISILILIIIFMMRRFQWYFY